MEGYMTRTVLKPTERLPIDRRRLLKTSAAAITTASLAPNVPLSEDPVAVSVHTTSTTSEAILKVSGATARRLAAIERRNELRRQVGLPVLNVVKELRKAKETEDNEHFSEAFAPFAAKHRQAVWNDFLKTRRNQNWRPSWIEGMALSGEVDRILRERFEAERAA
jgi:hypothetical protein